MDQINRLRQFLATQSEAAKDTTPKEAVPSGSRPPIADVNRPTGQAAHAANPQVGESGPGEPNAGAASGKDSSAAQEEPYKWGRYTPNFGFKLADTELGDLSISIYTCGPYLNQLSLNSTYTDASQGLGAQVVLAGNLSYRFNKHLSVH